MKSLPDELKLTYIIAIFVMFFFIGFIIFVVLMYNRKQILFIKEKQLKDAEYQNQILQKELEKQKSLENEHLRISRDMHDEIGAGISAIKLQSEILKMQSQNINHQEINELINISENMNHSMREMLWSLNAANDNLEQFANHCTDYLENYFAKTKIDFNFKKNINDPDKIISSEIRRNILMVLKEAAHNIVKHSHASRVNFDISDIEGTLNIKINDNGGGFNLSNSSSGYGLSSMKSRTESLGGTFDLTSDSAGTNISIKMN